MMWVDAGLKGVTGLAHTHEVVLEAYVRNQIPADKKRLYYVLYFFV